VNDRPSIPETALRCIDVYIAHDRVVGRRQIGSAEPPDERRHRTGLCRVLPDYWVSSLERGMQGMKIKRFFKAVRKDSQVQVWVPPVDAPEGEFVASFNVNLIPAFIAALKEFEQKEGRHD
jgi:hypothetical protein